MFSPIVYVPISTLKNVILIFTVLVVSTPVLNVTIIVRIDALGTCLKEIKSESRDHYYTALVLREMTLIRGIRRKESVGLGIRGYERSGFYSH